MKLSHVIAPALAAILATACASCTHEASAPDRAAQAEADKHRAQDEARDAELNAAKARADAQDAARAQYEADQKAHFAAEAAAQAERDAQLQNGAGVAEPQPVNGGVAVNPNPGVAFAVSSADLTSDEKARLDAIADRLRAHPTHRIVIAGYSDDIHADTPDSRLSRRRADCVAHYLEKRGVSTDRITVRTGTRNAVRYDDNRGYNRGVELVVD
jgi:outer membrane protein OmpA-like peptidoglycan-associated protein